MFMAAFTSALQAKLQATQAKRAWLLRLSAATCPHAEQRAVVPQHRFLGGRGEHPVPGHTNTLANSADIFWN
jgi:hypothetical protein